MITRRDALKLGAAGSVASFVGTSGRVVGKTGTLAAPSQSESGHRTAKYQSEDSVDELLGPFPFSREGKAGFFDRSGKVVVEPRYDLSLITSTRYFSEGLANVMLDGKWGYIDVAGKMQIAPTFSSAQEFSDGLAPVWMEDFTWGHIDFAGAFSVTPQFIAEPYPNVISKSHSFHDGLALVAQNYKFGYIDTAGTIPVPIQFEDAKPFSERLAAVQDHESRDGVHRPARRGCSCIPVWRAQRILRGPRLREFAFRNQEHR